MDAETAGMSANGAASPAAARFRLGDRQETAEHDQGRKTKGTPHGQTPSKHGESRKLVVQAVMLFVSDC
jgi:hypothetical protein